MNTNLIGKDKFRSRIEYEDGLLNARTGIFLVTNSVLGAGSQLGKMPETTLVMICFAIIICCLWLIVGFKHFRVIRALTLAYLEELESTGGDPIETIVQEASALWHPFRPTNILSMWLPSVALVAWIIVATINFYKII